MTKAEEYFDDIKTIYAETQSLKRTADKVARIKNIDSLSTATVKKILRQNGVKINSNRKRGVWGNERTI